MSSFLLPADPILRVLAAKVEEERWHALAQRSDLEVQPPAERARARASTGRRS